ncbi:MAG: alpha-glucuronidase family glycosyl hydrolase [Patescibacteria group bacterium]|nr:alpha-glucuronidase family glycosyl hydrolase [Patescibacteria group bacterium]
MTIRLGQVCTALLMALMLLNAQAEAATAPACPIVPVPKVYRDLGRTVTLQAADAAAIVVGKNASETEHYAAERLQELLERRFKLQLPILAEDDVKDNVRQVILLGQRSTNELLDAICREQKLDLSPTSPGHDGFLIEVVEQAGRQMFVIGGSNARGVMYGQDVFFDLVSRESEQVVFRAVSLRDWPSIPWRGRPHSVLRHHLVPGAMDAYVRARLNFTDVRDDPNAEETLVFEARKASMGCPAGVPLDEANMSRHIANSHRRGFFVYGTVSCAVAQEQFDAVTKTFQELIALGVDGLWISFDDTGAGGDGPEMVRRVLALGREHDMSGRAIAITPPLEEYQHIDKPFNHTVAAIPGMEDALWLFTRAPCKEDAETARRIGLKSLPGWWHNLVNIDGGFLHNGDVVVPLRRDNRPGYLNLQPLSSGWHRPDYEQLRDAEQNTDTVLLWGICGGYPEEYQMTALGLWAWDPARHNWDDVRTAVYRYVYGPSLVDTARRFDDELAELKSLFHLPAWRYYQRPGWPPRLKQPEDREKALSLLAELEKLRATLAEKAPAETAIDPARLESVYLEPMAATLDYGRRMAMLDYPDDALASLEERMLALLEAGDEAAVEQILAELRPTVLAQLERIGKELKDLKAIDLYIERLSQQVSGIGYWKQVAARRRAEMPARLKRLMGQDAAALFPYKETATQADLDALFVALPNPPAGQVVAEVKPEDWLKNSPRWQGAFCAGPYEAAGQPLVSLGYPAGVASKPGDFVEVATALNVPTFNGRLLLDAFVQDTRDDNRYRQFRFLQLWAGDQLLWEEDIAQDRKGREWINVDVTDQAKPGEPLALRFRVVDRTPVGSHLTVAFLGPVRLRAEP